MGHENMVLKIHYQLPVDRMVRIQVGCTRGEHMETECPEPDDEENLGDRVCRTNHVFIGATIFTDS